MKEIWAGAVLAAVMPLCTGLLMLLCRGEPVPGAAAEGFMPLTRGAAFIYRKTRNIGRARRQDPGADLAVLYPSRLAEGKKEAYEIGKIYHILSILLVGSLLSGAAVLKTAWDRAAAEDGGTLRLERETYGGLPREEVLTAVVEGSTEVEVPVTIQSRRYKPEELDRLADRLLEALPAAILGDGGRPDQVRGDLDLISALEGYPFVIRWETGDAGILSDEGKNLCTGDAGKGQEVLLKAVLSAEDSSGVRSYERTYALTVYPPEISVEERLRRELQGLISGQEEETRDQPYLELPGRLREGGEAIRWSAAGDSSAVILFLAAAAAAVLYAPLTDRQLHKEIVKRERQLREDYPVFVSRLALYMGAGMSLRNIFFRIGEDYRNARLRGGHRRYLGEEILLLNREMESGIPETEAYTHFAARCRSNVYARLVSLLTQNLRKGNSALLNVLHREAGEAFRERRITARIRGEEAETGLLFPMVIMLAVTMLIIMIPAYLSFTV